MMLLHHNYDRIHFEYLDKDRGSQQSTNAKKTDQWSLRKIANDKRLLQ
jgi:hypothetical protein